MGTKVFLYVYWFGIPVLSLILALVVGFATYELADKYRKWLGWSNPGGAILFGAIALIFGLFFGFSRAVNPLGEPIAIISHSNSVVATAGQNRDLVWSWDKRLRGNHVIDISPEMLETISMELQPITSNPKVRSLAYWVRVKAPGTPVARLKYLDRFKYLRNSAFPNDFSNVHATEFVKFQLYEFDEHHSKELAMLYNPLDEKQQAQLLDLLRSSIGPVLQDVGLEVESAGFSFVSVSDLIAKKSRD